MFVNRKRLLLAVYRLEEGQQEILAQLEKLRKRAVQPIEEGASHNSEPDEWIQSGIDNILSYSVEKKKEDGE